MLATEIQNIQLGDGNVIRDLTIPIYMVFPRLFTCATTIAKTFKVCFLQSFGATCSICSRYQIAFPLARANNLYRSFCYRLSLKST